MKDEGSSRKNESGSGISKGIRVQTVFFKDQRAG